MFPFPGDPGDPTYDQHIPNCRWPFIIGLGNVASRASSAVVDNARVFDINISEYVRDEVRSSPLT